MKTWAVDKDGADRVETEVMEETVSTLVAAGILDAEAAQREIDAHACVQEIYDTWEGKCREQAKRNILKQQQEDDR